MNYSRHLRHPLTILALTSVILVLSLGLWTLRGNRTVQTVFYYLRDDGGGMDAERRPVVYSRDLRRRVEVFLDEWSFGPLTLEYAGPFTTGRPYRSLILDGRVLHVDIRHEALEEPGSGRFRDPAELAELLSRNISRNFPRIEEVVLTVDGQEPGAPVFPTDVK